MTEGPDRTDESLDSSSGLSSYYPERVWILSTTMFMDTSANWKRRFILDELKLVGDTYEYEKTIDDLPEFDSPEEFALKARILGYDPLFNGVEWLSAMSYPAGRLFPNGK